VYISSYQTIVTSHFRSCSKSRSFADSHIHTCLPLLSHFATCYCHHCYCHYCCYCYYCYCYYYYYYCYCYWLLLLLLTAATAAVVGQALHGDGGSHFGWRVHKTPNTVFSRKLVQGNSPVVKVLQKPISGKRYILHVFFCLNHWEANSLREL